MPTQIPHNTEEDLMQQLQNFGISITPLLRRAMAQAKQSHQHQERDDGSSYLEQHIYPVAIDILNVYKEKTSELLVAGALLHDVLEDDDTFSSQRFIDEFGQELYDIVAPLTKQKSDNATSLPETRKREINQAVLVKLSISPEFSKLIKLADRTNNIACAALIKHTNEPKYNRYLLETREDYLPFAQRVSPYYYSKLRDTIATLDGLS